ELAEIQSKKTDKKQDLVIPLNSILKKIPISQVNIQNVQLDFTYGDLFSVTTENLYLKAYNEKSSLILSLKDPNIKIQKKSEKEPLNFLAEFQMMLTENTVSLSKLKIVKEDTFLIASGNMIYKKSIDNFQAVHLDTRLQSRFEDLKRWSNLVYKNDYFDLIKGTAKFDINLIQETAKDDIGARLNGSLSKFQVEKVKLGDFDISASSPDFKTINVEKISANLVGGNEVIIGKSKVSIDKDITFSAPVEIKGAQLHSFLKNSGIADIPVWVKIFSKIQCEGKYTNKLNIVCPGKISAKQLKIMNAGRNKLIVKAPNLDVEGNMIITEKMISYDANAQMKNTKGYSRGEISFSEGFKIDYESPFLDFSEIDEIAELKFSGRGEIKGSTQGNSRTAVFNMDIKAENFEFENYFFGELSTSLNYKTGVLYFKKLDGSIESTRYNGYLNVDLKQEKLIGDFRLPFFRMIDVEQALLKKVDLEKRFVGSGSGRVILDTPFDIGQLNFSLDARLFKGTAFGEEYNEAKLKAQSIDGIIILQEARLEKEKTRLRMKGTIDTELKSQLQFFVENGFLQLSTLAKKYKLPLSGQFEAKGEINGNLGAPSIKTKANIKNLIFNKMKYGNSVFSYDNSKDQTNLQLGIDETM
ncbi:MAG: hypothetical protein AAF203_09225, partial [Pseudomonadota bacterium]